MIRAFLGRFRIGGRCKRRADDQLGDNRCTCRLIELCKKVPHRPFSGYDWMPVHVFQENLCQFLSKQDDCRVHMRCIWGYQPRVGCLFADVIELWYLQFSDQPEDCNQNLSFHCRLSTETFYTRPVHIDNTVQSQMRGQTSHFCQDWPCSQCLSHWRTSWCRILRTWSSLDISNCTQELEQVLAQGTRNDQLYHKLHISANLPIVCSSDTFHRKCNYSISSILRTALYRFWAMASNMDGNFLRTNCSK